MTETTPPTCWQALGKRLQQARQQRRLKQIHAAQRLGLSVSSISAMETGQRKVDAFELFALARLYRQTLDWFFSGHPELWTEPLAPRTP